MKLGFKKAFSVFLIPIIIVVIVMIAIYLFLGISIWQNFLSNFLATILGAIIGIPIAIGINNQQEAKNEKLRKEKIIPLLREELLVNLTQLSSWQKSDFQKIETVYTGIFLEDGAWVAFSDSEELAFIQDPTLLKQLSHAYGSIRIVKQLSERYMDLVHLSDQKEKELLLNLVAINISKGIDAAIEGVTSAVKAI
jgi:hypothetical protein